MILALLGVVAVIWLVLGLVVSIGIAYAWATEDREEDW